MIAEPPEDPAELVDFPSLLIDEQTPLFRVHLTENVVEYYSARGDGRFDPPVHSRAEFGTCYLAETPVGAFLETLGRLRVVPESLVSERCLSEVQLTRTVRIADLTDPRVLGRFGIDGDLSVGRDYQRPQRWAGALLAAGFDGIRYAARHDPSFNEMSVALFGPVGPASRRLSPVKSDPQPISDEVIDVAASRFNVYVVPVADIL